MLEVQIYKVVGIRVIKAVRLESRVVVAERH